MSQRMARKDKIQIVHFEDFASQMCRYFLDRYGMQSCRCTHPENDEREIIPYHPGPLHIDVAACLLAACPLGVCLHPETDPEDRKLMQRRGFRPITDYSDETWMLSTVGDIRSAMTTDD